MNITADSEVVATEAVVSADLAGEAVMLHLETEMYFALDPVGTRVWELIQEPRAVAKVRDTIVAEYDVEPERCERDILTLLEDLRTHRLITVLGAPGAAAE